MAIWQDLVSDHGFPHGYQTARRFVRKLCGPESPQAVGIILTASATTAISSNAGRGFGGPSCRRNNEHRAENQPESHDLNYGRPRENAATAMSKSFFRASRRKWACIPKLRPTAHYKSLGSASGISPRVES